MEIIWFNPDKDFYEKGTYKEFNDKRSSSINIDQFEIIYEFNNTSKKISNKILKTLNLNRKTILNKS